MAHKIINRGKSQTASTGTSDLVVGATVSGYEPISNVGEGNTFDYLIEDSTNSEIGIGKYASGNLVRLKVLWSTNTDGLNFFKVNFPSGTKTITAVVSADRFKTCGPTFNWKDWAYEYRAYTNYLSSLPRNEYLKISTLSGPGSGNYKGSVLAPNGCIYSAPVNGTSILKLNTNTDTVSTFGSVSASNRPWGTGILGKNEKIYFFPFNGGSILVIDTTDDSLSEISVTATTNEQWLGAYKDKSTQKIYAFNYNRQETLELDTQLNAVTIVNYFSTYSFFGTTLGPEGTIVRVPSLNSNAIYHHTPTNIFYPTHANSSGTEGSNYSYSGLITAQNGNIYGLPNGNHPILKLMPYDVNNAMSKKYLQTVNMYAAGLTMGGNGMIYAMSNAFPQLHQFDPITEVFKTIPLPIQWDSYHLGTLAPNGCIYYINYDPTKPIIKVDTTLGRPVDINFCLSAYVNSL